MLPQLSWLCHVSLQTIWKTSCCARMFADIISDVIFTNLHNQSTGFGWQKKTMPIICQWLDFQIFVINYSSDFDSVK